MIAVPAFGRQILGPCSESIVETAVALSQRGQLHSYTTTSHPDIADLRCMLLTAFYDLTDATHLLMADADMRWPADLILDMVRLDVPVAGVRYIAKGPDGRPVGIQYPGEPRGHWHPAQSLGTGLILISRAAVTALRAAYPDLQGGADLYPICAAANLVRIFLFFQRIGHLSEDHSFCSRCHEAHIGMWITSAYAVGHWGLTEYTL